MRAQSTAISSVLCLLFNGFAVTEAGKDTIEVTEGGVTFEIEHYDDGRNKPYKVSWSDPDDGFSSIFTFNDVGAVTDIKSDGDKYKVKYKGNGKLKKVIRTTSRRTLAEEGDGVTEMIDGNDSVHSSGRRRLYDCDDCEIAMDILVHDGVGSVCDLVDYGNPILESAETAIHIFCDLFGSLSPEESCEGQCDAGCLAPLTITLEWSDDADLDLFVVEPVGGDRVFFNHLEGAYGYLDRNSDSGPDGPERYMVYGGIPPSSTSSEDDQPPLGEYWVIVRSFDEEYGSFKVTATNGNGDVILEAEEEFDADCERREFAHFFNVRLDEYIDNDCDIEG